MINLIYEKGEFRFEKAFESVTPQTMDVFLTVKDVVPDTQQPDLTQQACLFINKKLGTEYSTEGLGDFSKTEENMPDTKSYEKYQTGVTVLHVLSMDLKTALQNMKNQFNTYGVIRVAGYDNSISPLKSKVIEIEFSTDEIDEIERK